jgi:hypothetical protein
LKEIETMPKNLDGTITITRTHGADTDQPIRIRIIEESSGLPILDAQLGLAEFAAVLTGEGFVRCNLRYFDTNTDRIGLKRENKKELVFMPDRLGDSRKEEAAIVRAAVAAHEEDGWHGTDSDATNPHNWQNQVTESGKKGRMALVRFERWVGEDGEPVR